MSTPDPAPVLVIGIGSELRRDDAAGRRVADAVASRDLPGVEVRSVHQLVPELAEALAGRRRVVFVDATVSDREVAVRPIAPRPDAGVMTHHLDPAGLVTLARLLGSAPADAVVVSVPATDLGLGTGLSPAASAAVETATRCVIEACRADPQPPSADPPAAQPPLP